jgi:hypothetical protein
MYVCTQARRETRREGNRRKERTALSLGQSNFDANPALQLRFARGRRYHAPVARTPLSEELPRLVYHRLTVGHHPNSGPCFQEARLEQTLVSVADVLNARPTAAPFQMPHFRYLTFTSPIIHPRLPLIPTA